MSKLKKCLLVILSILVVALLLVGIFQVVSNAGPEVKYFMVSKFKKYDGENIGYKIKNKNGGNSNEKIMWDIVEVLGKDNTLLEEQPAAYCLKANMGFSDSSKSVPYELSFDMLTESDEIANTSNLLNQMVNGGKYNRIMTLLNIMYVPGESTPEYKEKVLTEASQKYLPGYLGENVLTDGDIEAVNRCLIWTLTNPDDITFRNYNVKDWLYYTKDGVVYDRVSDVSEARARQAEALYNYFIDFVETQDECGEIVDEVCKIVTAFDVANNNVIVREKPGRNSNIVARVQKDTEVTRVKKYVAYVNGYIWDKIVLEDGTEGYIANNYLEVVESHGFYQVNTPSGVVLRDAPNGNRIGRVEHGQKVYMLQKDAATANGNVWAKIRTLSGEEGYVAQRYLVESNKEYDTVDFTGFDIPATINSESQLECTVEGSNYILGPINVTKNNDYIYNVDVKVKIDETSIENFKLLDSNKNEISKYNISEGDFYISVPITAIGKIIVDVNVNYETTKTTLWTSKQGTNIQPIVIVEREEQVEPATFEVTPNIEPNVVKNELTKTGTTEIKERNDKVNYSITYDAELNTYVGTAKVTLEDKLPYPIKVEESELDDGKYNSETNTIVWEIELNDLNTFTEENLTEKINIVKNITVVYDNIDISQNKMVNTVTSALSLERVADVMKKTASLETVIDVKCEVSVKYIDKETGKEISEEVTKKGDVADPFDVKEDEKEITGYKIVEIPEETSGEFTYEKQEKIYYYAKRNDLTYKVNYIDKNTYEKISTTKVVENKTFEEIINSIDEIIDIAGYKFYSVDRDSLVIGVDEKENVINIYYVIDDSETKDLSYTVEYYIDGVKQDKDTQTVTKAVSKLENTIEVDKKDINTIDKYEGYLFDKTEPEEIPFKVNNGYIIKVYYAKKTQVIVNHINKDTGDKLAVVEDIGKVGQKYNSTSKNFENYVLTEKPEKETITLVDGQNIINYYYSQVSAGVVEKHIDVKSEKILHNEIHEYEEGSTYKIDSKEFEGYDLVEEKLPENSEGIVGIDPIEVTYYYIRKASVVVEHLDITTGEKLAENQRIVGHEGDSYKTEAKNIKDYELAQVPENKEGTMIITEDNEGNIITEIVVKYYYKQAEKQLAKVVEKHVDIETNKLIETETVYNGVEGDKYKTSSKTFEGYELVKDRLPQNAEGTMTAGVTEVVYYYSKKQSDIETPKEKVTIRVEHLEVGTGKKLAEDDVIVGEEGQNYTTNSKNISGFTLRTDKLPKNKDGVMKEDLVVKYYYEANKTNTPQTQANPEPPKTEAKENKPVTTNPSNNTNTTRKRLPDTGDELPIATISTIMFVIVLNVVVTVTTAKPHRELHKEPKKKKGRRLK